MNHFVFLPVVVILICLTVTSFAEPIKPDQTIVIEGKREASEASVSTASMRYLPFEVPEGVTKISIKKELDWGKDQKGPRTLDHGLFDPRGYEFGGPGFRGWQGGSKADLTLTGDRSATSPWLIAGPIYPGTWNLAQWLLESTPEGLKYKYTITFSFDGPTPPENLPEVPAYSPGVINKEAGWYVGNLHTHSIHSDGGHTLSEVIGIHKALGYQFIVSTDHNSTTAHYDFAQAAREYPDFPLIFGEEITSPSGHANVTGITPGGWFDFRMDGGDGHLPQVIDRAHSEHALFTVNHPFAGCTTCLWRYPEKEWEKADAIEVWNGRWTLDDRMAVNMWDNLLRAGKRYVAVGGSDFHRDGDVITPAAWIYADNLSPAAIMDAIRKGHLFLSDGPKGPKIYLSAENKTAIAGDTVSPRANDMVAVEAHVTGGNGLMLRLIWPDSDVSIPVTGDDAQLHYQVRIDPARKFSYVRAELVRADGSMAALTNPIFIETKR